MLPVGAGRGTALLVWASRGLGAWSGPDQPVFSEANSSPWLSMVPRGGSGGHSPQPSLRGEA